MKTIIRTVLIFAAIVVTTSLCLSWPRWHKLQVGDLSRRYLLAVPAQTSQPMPILVVFHGGGGTARSVSREGFSRLAEEENVLVVYPEGINRHWNVGRTDHPKFDPAIDDVAFTEALLDQLEQDYSIDTSRVYATGPSNGGMMSHRVGMELSHRFTAIAPVIGGIPKALSVNFAPTHPLSVLIIQGTQDPLVPYNGGPVTIGKRKWGDMESTDRTVELWREHNQCKKEDITPLPDLEDDGCQVFRTAWSGGREGTEVVLYRVEGGGHTMPGGSQYLPKKVIGTVCRDFSGIEVIWDFFASQSRPR